MEYFIVGLGFLIVGFIFGVILDSRYNKNRPTIGSLKIDTSEDTKDIYRLEIDKIPLDDLPKYKTVLLKIVSTVSPK